MKTKRLPKRFCELVDILAGRLVIEKTVKELRLPIAPDTEDERKELRSQRRELRSYLPKSQWRKIPKLLDMVAQEKLSKGVL